MGDSLQDAINGLEAAKQAATANGDKEPKLEIITGFVTVPKEEQLSLASKLVCELLDSDTFLMSCTSHAIKGIYDGREICFAVLHEYTKWAVLETDTLARAQELADDFTNFIQKQSGGEAETSVWVSPEMN